MSNRSHTNSAHRTMNFLRKKGLPHSSVADIEAAQPDETVHAVVVADCLELLGRIPDDSIQLVICDPPTTSASRNGTCSTTM